MIAPVQAPLVGDHVFYVQEMAADDPRRVLSQRLYVLNSVPDSESSAMTQLDFAEPSRWRNGHENRDLFRGLLMQDLRVRTGCDLLWKKSEPKSRFHCHQQRAAVPHQLARYRRDPEGGTAHGAGRRRTGHLRPAP